MRLLALDLGGTTGFAFWRDGLGCPLSGAMKFQGELGVRALKLEQWLEEKLVADEVSHLAVEAPVPMQGATSFDSIRWLYGANLIVQKVAHKDDVDFREIHLPTWRSHFLGTTKAPAFVPKKKKREWLKQASIDACAARGWPTESRDEAEALGLLDCFRSMLDPTYGAVSSALFREKARAA